MSDHAQTELAECAMHLAPLSSPQSRREVLSIVNAYAAFWDNRKFRDGLTAPPFSREEVDDLLRQAAEFVVYIRRHLDRLEPGHKNRVLGGSAQEFLWSVDWDPRSEPTRFVRELVHATLQDAHGYVEDLSREAVDEFIAEVEAHFNSLPNRKRCLSDLDLKAIESLAGEVLANLAFIRTQGIEIESQRGWPALYASLSKANEIVLAIIASDPRTAPAPGSPRSATTPCTARKARLQQVRRRKEIAPLASTEPQTPTSQAPTTTPSSVTTEQTEEAKVDAPQEAVAAEPQATEVPEVQVSSPSTKDSVSVPAAEGEPQSDSNGPTEAPAPTEPTPEPNAADSQPAESDATEKAEEVVPAEPAEPSTKAEVAEEPTLDEAATAEETSEVHELPQSQNEAPQAEFTIKIGKVKERVDRRREDVFHLLEECRVLDAGTLNEQLIGKLQKRCLESSESLMNDMLALDGLVSSNNAERSQRKAQIVAIQEVLDSIDEVQKKLSQLRECLQPQPEGADAQDTSSTTVEPPASPQSPQPDVAPVAKPQPQAASQPAAAPTAPQPKKDLQSKLRGLAATALKPNEWKQLKMEPKFEVAERADHYLIQAFIPGMRKQDVGVNLSDDESTLEISGVRLPTQNEVRTMLQQLMFAIESRRVDPQSVLETPDEQLLLTVGSGRYGTFQQRYQLPDDADPHRIEAEYERGVLRVVVWKAPRGFGFPPSAGFMPFFNPGMARRQSHQPRRMQPSFEDLFW